MTGVIATPCTAVMLTQLVEGGGATVTEQLTVPVLPALLITARSETRKFLSLSFQHRKRTLAPLSSSSIIQEMPLAEIQLYLVPANLAKYSQS